jgi:hypothetical protein
MNKHESETTQVKVFYAALNEQKKAVNKELNIATEIIIKDLKASTFCTTEHEDCKNLVRTLKEFSDARKEFHIQDNKWKSAMGEVINRRN